MDYLKEYNLSETDIEEIVNNIDEMDRMEYEIHEENICKILDYLKEKDFDIKKLLMYKSYMFYTKYEVLVDKLNTIPEDKISKINGNIDKIDDYL